MRWVLSLILAAVLFACGNSGNADGTKGVSEDEYADMNSIQKELTEGQGLNLRVNVVSSNNDTLLLQDIVSNELWYIRYSNYACQECVDFIVDKMSDKIRMGQCVYLVSEMPQRDMHVYESTQEGAMLYLVDSLNVDFDEALTPYVFRLQDGIVKDFIVPRKEQEDLFDRFLGKNDLVTDKLSD